MESASQGPESNEFISADCLIAKSSFPTTTETPADSASLIHNDVTTTTTSESSLELSDSIDFVSLTQVGSDDVTLSQMNTLDYTLTFYEIIICCIFQWVGIEDSK